MSEEALLAAIGALSYWSNAEAHSDQLAPGVTTKIQEHVRQSAWKLVGQINNTGKWPSIQAELLASIFSQITPGTAKSSSPKIWPAALRLDKAVLFAQAAIPGEDPLQALQRYVRQQPAYRDHRAQSEYLLFALQRYAWSLPSPLAGISRYDFARMHAALAAATITNPQGNICLVGGDLSGVQEFIYNIPAKGATKQLRGRSLYLQLLTDACAHAILDATGMPLTNQIYAGGGRFYLLLPAGAEQQIDTWRSAIGQRLLKAHAGSLYLALGAKTFEPDNYNRDVWQQLTHSIDADKRRRFAALGDDAFKKLFTPKQPRPLDPTTGEEQLDPMSASLERLGQQMAKANRLEVQPLSGVFGRPERLPDQPRASQVLTSLGLRIKLSGEEEIEEATRIGYQRILWLNDNDDPESLPANTVMGLRYTVTQTRILKDSDRTEISQELLLDDQDQAIESGSPMPFNLLAEQSSGIKRIGVLRMDVDDLGSLFGTRLKRADGMAALATVAALSASLSRFFEGWVGKLCEAENQKGNGGVYAVYSGGDDLFLVGSWNRMPGLAQQIRNDFTRYVHGEILKEDEQPLITLSAGITLHTGSYPLYQAAEDAAEALDSSKQFQRDSAAHQRLTHPKDAITILGRTIGWEQFTEVISLRDQLAELLGAGVARNLLITLQSLDQQAQAKQHWDKDGKRQISHGPWIWHAAYLLTRQAERVPDLAKPKLALLRDNLLNSTGIQNRLIERAGLAARWQQLLIRERNTR